MPKLSIIIPFYNAEQYLGECLKSAVVSDSQFEFILIDDGSTDSSLDICKKYKQQDNVIIKTTKNMGVSHARNLGIKNASGEYIMFVDADDYLLDNWRRCFKYVEESALDIAIFSCRYDGSDFSKNLLMKACIGYSGSILDDCNIMSPWSRFYKREFLIDNNLYFDEDLINGEDMLFNLIALTKANSVKIFAEGFYYYRINTSSATHKFGKNIIKSDFRFRKLLNDIVGDNTDMRDAVLISNANSLYLILESLIRSNMQNIDECILEILQTHDVESELKAIEATAAMNGFRKKIILLLLRGKIKYAIFIMKIKLVVKRRIKNVGGVI